jgi:ADP-heptose:LPS heptosyltransferase
MGDIIMSSVAMRALKQSFGARITLLASPMGAGIVPFIPEVDDVLVADLPWVKAGDAPADPDALVRRLRENRFDLAVIFTVYSQSALPAALLCWQAGIPARAAYCRENPYSLLTHWIPDKEPYSFIRHQVERDLDLVRSLGATVEDERLWLRFDPAAAVRVRQRLSEGDIDPAERWILLHPGVSEKKREYPLPLWIETARLLRERTGMQLLVTGAAAERERAELLCREAGDGVHSLAGRLDLAEFVALIRESPLVVCVNTVTAHIAAAAETPVIVLYAMTNPQHIPWTARSEVLPFGIAREEWSRNEVIRYVSDRLRTDEPTYPSPLRVLTAVERWLSKAVVPEKTPADQ